MKKSVKRKTMNSEASTPGRPRPFRIGFLVHDVSRMRKTAFDQAMKSLGVTRAQWWVLANLSRNGDKGMIQVELARVLDLGKVSLGGLLDRLEASGYIERRASPDDRRVKLVYVTPKGHQTLQQMEAVANDRNKQIFANLSADDIRHAEDVLHQMKNNLRAMLAGHDDASGDEDPPDHLAG